MRLKPLLLRFPLAASALGAAQVAGTVVLLITLHPYEYAAMNLFAGGVPGAKDRFDLDYWSAAGTEALRRLEPQLAASHSDRPAKILMCIPYREKMAGTLFRQRAIVETDPKKADYIIETERSRCGHGIAGTVIDEVKRDGVQFARTIATNRHIGDTQSAGRPAS
jgi:hypothetical protein